MSLILAISGVLHKQAASVAQASYVGGVLTAPTLSAPASGQQSVAFVVSLPSGTQAGDTAILTCGAQAVGSGALTITGAAGDTVAASGMLTLTAYAVIVHRVTSTEATAGSVTLQTSGNYPGARTFNAAATADVWRAAASVDVVGTVATGSKSGTTQTITAPGVTSLHDGSPVQYAIVTTNSAMFATPTAPSGWTLGGGPQPIGNGAYVATGYKLQALPGATGDAAASFSSPISNSQSYIALQIALRADASLQPAAMTLTGTLTATATVGTPYSSTLTLAGDYVAPVTIDAANGTIPAWLAPTVSGGTVTFSGTPDSDDAVSFTPRATDANGQKAVGSAQTITVSEASAGFAPIQTATGALGSPVSLPAPATKDNLILLLCGFNAGNPTCTGFTRLNSYGSGNIIKTSALWKIAAGGEQSFNVSGQTNPGTVIAVEVPGVTAITVGADSGLKSTATITPNVPSGTFKGGFIILGNAQGTQGDASFGAGWTALPYTSQSTFECQAAYGDASALSNTTITPAGGDWHDSFVLGVN